MSQLVWGVGQWGVDEWVYDAKGLALGNHRFRLLVRWYDREDLFPTHFTWLEREDTYATTLTNYATYQDLYDNIGGGIELDVDLTCDVAGITTEAGRSSITEQIRASELAFSLVDEDGTHDPRITPIQSRSRIGARVRLEVAPNGGSWRPVMTTWVDSWRKRLTPSDTPQVDVQSADGLKMLAQAKPAERGGQPEGHAEGLVARASRVLDQIPWNIKWGGFTYGYSSGWAQLNPLEWDGEMSALDHLRDCATVEDGLLYVLEDGTLHIEGDGWRTTRTNVVGVDLVPEEGSSWSEPVTAELCPTELTADDNDIDIINAATVYRSTQYDALVGDPPQQPDVIKRYASDTESISYYGEHREVLSDLPAWSNTRTQTLADRWVARYKDGAQDIGYAEFDLVRRPQDAEAILNLQWGDKVLVRDRVAGTLIETVHEVIGISHAITPYRWEVTLRLDRKAT